MGEIVDEWNRQHDQIPQSYVLVQKEVRIDSRLCAPFPMPPCTMTAAIDALKVRSFRAPPVPLSGEQSPPPPSRSPPIVVEISPPSPSLLPLPTDVAH